MHIESCKTVNLYMRKDLEKQVIQTCLFLYPNIDKVDHDVSKLLCSVY